MKTRMKRTESTLVVNFDGVLEYDTHEALREDLQKLRRISNSDQAPSEIIFDLKGLEFVGSTGISAFIQILKEFNASAPSKPRYMNVKSEFRQLIRAFDQDQLFDFFDSDETSKNALDH